MDGPADEGSSEISTNSRAGESVNPSGVGFVPRIGHQLGAAPTSQESGWDTHAGGAEALADDEEADRGVVENAWSLSGRHADDGCGGNGGFGQRRLVE